MGWLLLLWSLKILITLLNILASFKALKIADKRTKRLATLEKEAAGGKVVLSSIERASRRNLKAQLTTWVVWVTFCSVERIADKTLFILPLYDELKVMGLLFILAWRSAGAELVFKKLIKPLVTPYERPLDALGFVINEILNVFIGGLLLIPDWIGRKWTTDFVDEVPNIMKSLKIPARPILSHQLADSIEVAQANRSKALSNQIDKILEVPITHPRKPIFPIMPTASTSRLPVTTVPYSSSSVMSNGFGRLPRASSTSQLSKATSRALLPTTSTSRNTLNKSSRIPSNSIMGILGSADVLLNRTGPLPPPSKSLYPDLSGSIPTPFDQLGYRQEVIQQQQQQQEKQQQVEQRELDTQRMPLVSTHRLRTSTSRSSDESSKSSQLPPPLLPSSRTPVTQPQYRSPSPPPTPPPAAVSTIPFVIEPPTPAPPGSFQLYPTLNRTISLTTISTSTSSSTSSTTNNNKPLRNPTIDILASGELTPAGTTTAIPSSPREKAAWAIRNLGSDLDGVDDLLMRGMGSAKKRGRKVSNDSVVEEEEDKKVVKKSRKIVDQMKGKKVVGKGKGKAVESRDEDFERRGEEVEDEDDDDDDGTQTATSISKRIIGTKRSRSNSPIVTKKLLPVTKPKVLNIKGATSSQKITNTNYSSSSSEEEMSVPVSKSKLKATSSRSLKPPSLSSSVSTNNLSISVRVRPSSTSSSSSASTSRNQLSSSTSRNRLASSSTSTTTRNPLSLSTSSSSTDLNSNIRPSNRPSRLATAVSRVRLDIIDSKEKVPEKKKPRRVLLGVVKNLEGSEGEEDGVPVVRRKRA